MIVFFSLMQCFINVINMVPVLRITTINDGISLVIAVQTPQWGYSNSRH